MVCQLPPSLYSRAGLGSPPLLLSLQSRLFEPARQAAPAQAPQAPRSMGSSSKGRQAKLTAFLSKSQDADSSPTKNTGRGAAPARPRQARLDSLPGVVRLPKMSGHANESELHRLLDSMDPSSSAEDIIQAMKQAACYEFTVDQLEAVPLGKRVKALRQHDNPEVQQQAARLLQKMRQDVKDACSRTARARPIVAHLTRPKATKKLLGGG